MAIGMEGKVILKQFQLNVRCSTTPLTDDCYIYIYVVTILPHGPCIKGHIRPDILLAAITSGTFHFYCHILVTVAPH